MSGIPITVRCECGEQHDVLLGDVVTCSCGRVYRTEPPDDVRMAIFRARRALDVAKRAGLLAVPAVGMLGIIATGSAVGILAAPVAGVVWYAAVLPAFKRRYATALGTLRWTSGPS